MVTMNLENFASMPQDELIAWSQEKAEAFADGELEISNAESISNDELTIALAIYKLLAKQNLRVKGNSYNSFITSAEAELRRRVKG